MLADAAEDILLDRLVLGGGLDDDVASGHVGIGRRGLHPGQDGVHLGLGHVALGYLALQVAANGVQALVDLRLADVVQQHVIAREGADMGDARAHLTGADHADGLDCGHWFSPLLQQSLCRSPPGPARKA